MNPQEQIKKLNHQLGELTKAYEIAIGEINKYFELKEELHRKITLIFEESDCSRDDCLDCVPIRLVKIKIDKLFKKLK